MTPEEQAEIVMASDGWERASRICDDGDCDERPIIRDRYAYVWCKAHHSPSEGDVALHPCEQFSGCTDADTSQRDSGHWFCHLHWLSGETNAERLYRWAQEYQQAREREARAAQPDRVPTLTERSGYMRDVPLPLQTLVTSSGLYLVAWTVATACGDDEVVTDQVAWFTSHAEALNFALDVCADDDVTGTIRVWRTTHAEADEFGHVAYDVEPVAGIV